MTCSSHIQDRIRSEAPNHGIVLCSRLFARLVVVTNIADSASAPIGSPPPTGLLILLYGSLRSVNEIRGSSFHNHLDSIAQEARRDLTTEVPPVVSFTPEHMQSRNGGAPFSNSTGNHPFCDHPDPFDHVSVIKSSQRKVSMYLCRSLFRDLDLDLDRSRDRWDRENVATVSLQQPSHFLLRFLEEKEPVDVPISLPGTEQSRIAGSR